MSKIANDIRKNVGTFQKIITNELNSNITTVETVNAITVNADNVNISTLSGDIVGTTAIQTLTNKTINDISNNVASNRIITSTSNVLISGPAPTENQVIVASDSTNASWNEVPSKPYGFFISDINVTGIANGTTAPIDLDVPVVSVGGAFELSGTSEGILVNQTGTFKVSYSVNGGNDLANTGAVFTYTIYVNATPVAYSGILISYFDTAVFSTISKTCYVTASAGDVIFIFYSFSNGTGTGRLVTTGNVPSATFFIQRL